MRGETVKLRYHVHIDQHTSASSYRKFRHDIILSRQPQHCHKNDRNTTRANVARDRQRSRACWVDRTRSHDRTNHHHNKCRGQKSQEDHSAQAATSSSSSRPSSHKAPGSSANWHHLQRLVQQMVGRRPRRQISFKNCRARSLQYS